MTGKLKPAFAVAAFVAVSGCANTQWPQGRSIPSDPAVGQIIELAAPVEVVSGEIKTWFDPMYNRAQPLSLSSIFTANPQRDGVKCGLELSRRVLAGGPNLVLSPGPLKVVAVQRVSDPYGIDPATVSAHSGYSTDVSLNYRLEVESASNPELRALFCSQRHASLARGSHFPDVRHLREQAGGKLIWTESTSTAQ